MATHPRDAAQDLRSQNEALETLNTRHMERLARSPSSITRFFLSVTNALGRTRGKDAAVSSGVVQSSYMAQEATVVTKGSTVGQECPVGPATVGLPTPFSILILGASCPHTTYCLDHSSS